MLPMVLALGMVSCTKPETYTNPVWPHDFPDPFIAKSGDTFYAYGTHNSPAGFQLLTSKDLVHWQRREPVGKPSWSSDQLWAPEVFQWKDKWYLFFSAKDPKTGKRDLAVSVGRSLDGPFEDKAKLVLGSSVNSGPSDEGAIDPTVYVEGGKPYLLYIREAEPRSILIAQLSDDLSKTVGEHKTLLLTDRPFEKGVLDAPTLLKKNGKYWLFYSSGWFQSWKRDASYQVWAACSDSLMGPYVKPKEPVLTTKHDHVYLPGHQSVLQLSNGDWWIAYHAWDAQAEPLYGRNPAGRTLRIDRLTWTAKGPVTSGPTSTPQPLPQLD